MKRHRRKHCKRVRRFHKGVFISIVLLLLGGMSVVAWRYSLEEANLQKEEQKEPMNQEENVSTDDRNTGSQEEKAPLELPKAEQEPQPLPEPTKEELLDQEVEKFLEQMTLEEKICQMFILTPEQLTGVATVTAAHEATRAHLQEYPVGGLIYFAANLVSEAQTKEMLKNTRDYGKEIEGLPLFLCIDEEGGRVARVGNNPSFSVEQVKPMGQIVDVEEAYGAGKVLGAYLRDLGFNVDFAPDVDVLTNEKNTVIGDRSFGNDPQQVTSLAIALSNGLHAEGILSTFKHFPGHGATEADTHEGYAYIMKTYEELKSAELVPFAAAKDCGVEMVMVGHISLPNIVDDHTPSSLSKKMITEILRKDLGYEGLVVTDALNMGAIGESYSSGEAAVKAVEAGVDLLLMPQNFSEAYQSLVDAVTSGRITEERIEESLERILRVKLSMEEIFEAK